MKDLKIVLYHPQLAFISDRSFRSLLKKLSSVVREFQHQEIQYLVDSFEISDSQKQSLNDKMKHSFSHIEAYYFEKYERGSIELAISVTAVGIWLLQITIGESIKVAYLRSELHHRILEYLSSSDERKEFLDHNIDRVFDSWRFDQFNVEHIEKSLDDAENPQMKINLSSATKPGKDGNEKRQKYSIERAIRESEEAIKKPDRDPGKETE